MYVRTYVRCHDKKLDLCYTLIARSCYSHKKWVFIIFCPHEIIASSCSYTTIMCVCDTECCDDTCRDNQRNVPLRHTYAAWAFPACSWFWRDVAKLWAVDLVPGHWWAYTRWCASYAVLHQLCSSCCSCLAPAAPCYQRVTDVFLLECCVVVVIASPVAGTDCCTVT